MAYTSGFFDAIDQGGGDYDRVYSAATFAHYFSLLVQNGVFPDPSTGMQVKASTSPDMHVSVQPGSGWVNGYYITVEANAPEQLTVPTANPSLSRIDSVIMGLNYVDREVQLYIKSGAVSASPSAVSLQRDNDLYELELAQITVSAGMASITQASITDMRSNTNRCGIVKGMIDQIDTTDLFAQYNDAFQTWFAGIKAQLSDNVATNLQNQIDTLKTDKVNVSDKASTAQAQTGTDDTKWMTPALVKTFYEEFKANKAEVIAATDGGKWVSPLTLGQKLTPIIQGIAKSYNLNLLAEYSTAGARTVSFPSNTALVYAVIVGGGEGGGSGATNGSSSNVGPGGKGGDGGNIRIIGPLTVNSLTNKVIVVGKGGEGATCKNSYSSTKGEPGGTSSAFGFTASGGGNSPRLGEIIGGKGGVQYSGSTLVNTSGETLGLVDFLGIKTLSPGGGVGGGINMSGTSGGTSSVGNGGSGGKGTSTSGDGSSGSPGSNGGCTAGGGGGGCGTYTVGVASFTGGKGGNGGPGYVAVYITVKGV